MDVTKLTADDLLVDLSSHNSVTDYNAMRSLNSAGWSKATQGSGYVNPLFTAQMNGMANAGMTPGAYHFPDPNVSAASNVSHFLSVAGPWITQGRLMPMLDVENDVVDGISWNAGSANAFIPAWVAELRRQTGMNDLGVVIYGSDSWWGSTLRPEMWGDLSRLFFMDAIYNGQPGLTLYKHARLAVHQYTDAAPTPGVKAPTDRSVIMRDNGFALNDLVIGDDMTPDDLISPDGLVDDTGKQVTDKVKNFLGYGDTFAKQAKDVGVSNGTKLDAILAALGAEATVEQQRDAELLAAVKGLAITPVDPNALAEALTKSGLPQAVVQQLLDVLSKASATSTPAS
jgi:GH25 family lysozyme M1 (1,4-beta-N-acetylmuramidase)